jgi:hypothetical protein
MTGSRSVIIFTSSRGSNECHLAWPPRFGWLPLCWQSSNELDKLLPGPAEIRNLRIELQHPLPNELLRVATGADPPVSYLQQFANLPQPKPEPLSAPVEAQSIDHLGLVESISGMGSRRSGSKPDRA